MLKMKSEDLIPSKYMQTCDIPIEEFKVEPFTMVVFGGTGDLSKRKLLPALFHLYQDDEFSGGFSILGVARSKMTDEEYRHLIKEAIQTYHEGLWNENQWENFSKHIFYLSGAFDEAESYTEICEKIDQLFISMAQGAEEVIYYMAVPPESTPLVVEKLRDRHLCRERFNTKIIVEKPFGRDFSSAVELN